MNLLKNYLHRKTPVFIISLFLFLLTTSLFIVYPLSNTWKNFLGNYFAAVYSSTPSSESFGSGVDSNLYSIIPDNSGGLYLGGSFNMINSYIGSGIPLSPTTGSNTPLFPKVIGAINSVIQDNAGGWYIGGAFTQVGSYTRNRMAHILPDGTVDINFNPDVNSVVRAIVLSTSTNTLYIGGDFTLVNSQTRNRIAALNTSNGSLVSSFNSDDTLNNTVRALALSPDNNKLYVGGSFTTFSSLYSGGGLSISTTTGANSISFPKIIGSVSIAIQDNAGGWYIGGVFTQVGSYTRNRLAHILSDGSVDSNFNPNVNNTVSCLLLSTSTNILYVGGNFTTIGTTTRNRLAAINLNDNSLVNSFDPSVNANVQSMVLSTSTNILYIGGSFTIVGTAPKIRFAAINTSNGSLVNTIPDWYLDNAVNSLSLSIDGLKLYVGGGFTNTGILVGNGVQLSTTTGANSISFPKILGAINSIVQDNAGGWYIGGAFTQVGSYTINRLAHILSDGSVDTNFNPNVNNTVSTMALATSTNILYFGGVFSTVGSTTRNRLAAINLNDNSLVNSFDPNPNSTVASIALSSSTDTLYVGGQFTSIGGLNRYNLAAINTTDGLAIPTFYLNTNGSITALAVSPDGNRLYFGGGFTTINTTFSSGGGTVSSTTGLATPNFSSNISGTNITGIIEVRSVVSDGNNGWYIGGKFTAVGTTTRNRLAHIFFDGTVDPNFDPSVMDGSVYAMVLSTSTNTLYIGGTFTSVGGLIRYYLAAIDISNGSVKENFDPNPNNTVRAIALSTSTNILYIGGDFTSVNSQTRNRIASVNVLDGSVVSTFDPNLNNQVNALAFSIDGNYLYIGGTFTTIGTTTRNYIVEVNASDGTFIPSFNPGPNSQVQSLLMHPVGDRLYIGGSFTNIGSRLASVVPTTGSSSPVTPGGSDGTVYSLALSRDNSILYYGGRFGAPGPYNITANRTSNGASINSTFYPTVTISATIYGIAVSEDNNTVYLAGDYGSFGGVTRNTGGSADLPSGTVNSVYPNPNTAPNFMLVSPDNTKLYMTGGFSVMNGSGRNRVGSINVSNNSVTSFNPNSNATVNTIALSRDGSTAYLGGSFTQIGATARNNMAAVNTSDGSIISGFNPNTDGTVNAVALSNNGNYLFAGGSFSVLGSINRNRLLALNTSDGSLNSFNPNSNGNVNFIALSPDGNRLYLGGSFTSVSTSTRNRLAAINTSDGSLVSSFAPNLDNQISTIALSPDGNFLYTGGVFTSVNTTTRNRIAAINTSDGSLVSTFNPNPDNTVITIGVSNDGGALFIGGAFTSLGALSRNRLLALNTSDGSLVSSFDPNLANNLLSMTISTSTNTLYFGGDFLSVGTTTRNRLASINLSDGSLTSSFNPNVNFSVNALYLSPDNSKLYLGGIFTSVGTTSRSRLAAVSTIDGSVTSYFAPVLNSAVNTINGSLDGNTIYIGGDFTVIGTTTRTRIAALNASDGSVISSFVSTINSTVSVLCFSTDYSLLYTAGAFTQTGGVFSPMFAHILSNGVLDDKFNNLNINGSITTMAFATSTNIMYIGGSFTNISSTTRNRVAAINLTDGSLVSTFNPNINNSVNSIKLSPSQDNLYVSGAFTNVGGLNKNRLVKLNVSDGSLVSAFSPNVNGAVSTLLLNNDGTRIYIGGLFSAIGTTTRNNIAALNTSNGGLISSFNPNINSTVNILKLNQNENVLYIGGIFTSVGTTTRNRLAAVNVSNGSLITTFNPSLNGDVITLSMDADESTIYVGGSFTTVGTTTRNRIAALNSIDGSVLSSFDPNANSNIRIITPSILFDKIYVGGDFTTIGSYGVARFATFPIVSGSVVRKGGRRILTSLIDNESVNLTKVDSTGGTAVVTETIKKALTSDTQNSVYPTTKTINKILTFNKNLKLDMQNDDVKRLQIFLNNNGFIISKSGTGSPGKESTYFGNLTKLAVIKFQEKYLQDILDPLNLEKGTGIFGPYSRKMANKILLGQ